MYVSQIEFRDKHTHDNFTCQIHDWISVDDETDGWMELPVQWPWIETLPRTYKWHTTILPFQFNTNNLHHTLKLFSSDE